MFPVNYLWANMLLKKVIGMATSPVLVLCNWLYIYLTTLVLWLPHKNLKLSKAVITKHNLNVTVSLFLLTYLLYLCILFSLFQGSECFSKSKKDNSKESQTDVKRIARWVDVFLEMTNTLGNSCKCYQNSISKTDKCIE